MSIAKCSGPDAITNAEKLLDAFLRNPEEQIFLLTGDTGMGKTTMIRKKMELMKGSIHFHRYTIIDDTEIFRKSLKKHPSDIHIWESVYSTILEDIEIQSLLRDIAFGRIEFKGKLILIGDDLIDSVAAKPDIIMGASIDMPNDDFLDHLGKTLFVENLIRDSFTKKIQVYVDMDNVLVDFPSAFKKLDPELLVAYKDKEDEIPNIFSMMEPLKDAQVAFKFLSANFDTYILSTAPWNNPSAWSDKLLWVKKYLGEYAYKRLILTHHKDLNRGDFLIDDRTKNGAGEFRGELIQFGSDTFPDWKSVIEYMKQFVK